MLRGLSRSIVVGAALFAVVALGACRDTGNAEGKLFEPNGAKGRYVRLYSKGNTTNDLNHYVEVEVYGLPK